jgi:hypothetical protein
LAVVATTAGCANGAAVGPPDGGYTIQDATVGVDATDATVRHHDAADAGHVTPIKDGSRSEGEAATDSTSGCGYQLTMCNGFCVDTSSNPSNCGKCGVSCETGVCGSGQCALPATPPCPKGQTQCTSTSGDTCTDLSNDPDNCGTCGIECASPGTCVDAGCTAGEKCEAPKVKCDAACVNLSSNSDNCGHCGRKCAGVPSGCIFGTCMSGYYVDAGYDAGHDAGHDAAGLDAGHDAGHDTGHDAGHDSGHDAGLDAGRDAGLDAGRDAG